MDRRHALKLAALAAVGAVLSACQSAAPTRPANTASTGATTAASGATAAVSAPSATQARASTTGATAGPSQAPATVQGQANLEIWYDAAAFTPDMYNQLFGQIESDLPGIKLTSRVGVPFADYLTKLLTSVAGGATPDVLLVHPALVAAMATKGILMPLDDFFKGSGLPRDDYFPAYLSYVSWAGKLYAMPYQPEPTMYFYNTALIQAAKMDDPRALFSAGKWTADTYLQYIKALTTGSGPDKIYGSASLSGTLRVYDVWVWGFGGEIFSQDSTQALFDSPEAVKGFTYLTDQIKNGYTPNGYSTTVSMPQMNSGKAVFLYNVRSFNAQYATNLKLSTVPVPILPATGKSITRGATNGFGVGAKSKHPDMAWKVAQWWGTKGNEILMNMGAASPATKSLANGPFQKVLLPWESLEVWQTAADTDRVLPLPPAFAQIDRLVNTAFDNIALNGKDPTAVWKDTVAQSNAALKA
jgi:multiple sugar transport system substrate-binding protein